MKDKILKDGKLNIKEQFFVDAFCFIFGFIISFAKISGMIAPFCLSFSMALKKRLSVFCFLGSIFGITLSLNSENIIYLFILSLGLISKILLKSNSSLKNAVFCSVCFILPYTISIIIFPIGFGTLMLLYSKMVFCAAVTALCTQSLKNFSFDFKDRVYDFLVFLIFFVVVLISFCNLNFFSINFGRFISAFFIAQIFLIYDYFVACVFGLVITIAFTLYMKDFSKFGVILAISAFFGGIFRRAGKFFQILTFLFTYFFCCMFFGGINIFSLIEVLIASFLALVIPKNFFSNIMFKDIIKVESNGFNINDKISSKLKFAANMLLDLQQSIKKCATIMDMSSYKDLNNLCDKLCDSVCKDCGLKTFCWITAYSDLSLAFSDVSSILRKDGCVDEKTIPIFFSKKCCRLKNLIQNINFSYKEYLCFELNKRRVNEARDIATEQFVGVADFLFEMSDEIKSVKQIDYINTEKILQIFRKDEIKVKNLFCFLDEFERVSVDVYLYSILEKDKLKKLKAEISELLEKNFCSSSFTKAGDCFKISFFEETDLSIQFAVEQVAVDGNKYCGDSYQYFIDEKGFAHIILSDGMGNGKRAALDSLMTCSTLRKFIESGFGFKSALKLLNLSFAIKSKEESLATVDSFTIDLYTGESRFIKAGATSSYVSTKGKVLKFNSKSLPIGIIQGITFDSQDLVLYKGDVGVMVSDGATSFNLDWIENVLEKICKKEPNYIARYILECAKKMEDKEHLDDVTVIVFKIV